MTCDECGSYRIHQVQIGTLICTQWCSDCRHRSVRVALVTSRVVFVGGIGTLWKGLDRRPLHTLVPGLISAEDRPKRSNPQISVPKGK